MKQWMKRISVWMLAMVFCLIGIWSMSNTTYAAGANVTIAVSGTNLKIGDTVNVTITISSGNIIGAYSMAVTYNSGVLEYTGGSGSGGGGTVMIAGYGDGSATRLSANLSFKAIANGSSTIATSGGEAYDWDENSLAISHGGTTITVSAPTTEGTTAGSTSEGPASTTEAASTSADSDCSLKSLEVSPGTLEPAFRPSITEYTVNVPEDTTSIVISAVANKSDASVTVTHNNDLEPGANKTYVVVTAPDGNQRTYTLYVNCGDVEEEPSGDAIEIDGVTYVIASQEQMAEVELPKDFSLIESQYNGNPISVYESPNHLIYLVYLLDEDGNGDWFLYDMENQRFSKYIECEVTAGRFVILDVPADVEIPDGYELTQVVIQEHIVNAYQHPDKVEFLLVYATNLYNEAGFYEYDTLERTLQRYHENEPLIIEQQTVQELSNVSEPVVTEDDKVKHLRTLVYVLCGVTVLLIVLVIVGMSVIRKQNVKDDSSKSSGRDYEDEDI